MRWVVVALTLQLLVPLGYLERFLEIEGWSLRGLNAGEYRWSLERTQQYLIQRDPVLWAERMLIEPSDGHRWRLFDYQVPALRYQGNAIFQCGSEVGKTREIVARALWRALCYKRTILIGAAQDGHLESIYEELRFQLDTNPFLRRLINWKETKRKPYRKITTIWGNRIYLRPAGLEGEAFRNLHVDDAYFDEAALVVNEKTWGNFFSRVRPGGEKRIYSTPNGNRATRYYEIAQAATSCELYWEKHPEALDPLAYPIPGDPAMLRIKEAQPTFLRVLWPKTLMPAPFYTKGRWKEWLYEYGGEDNPEFQQHVLGLHGERVDSVFPLRLIEPCCGFLATYRHLKIRRAAEGVYTISVDRLSRHYRPGDEEIDAEDESQAGKLQPFKTIAERERVRIEDRERDGLEVTADWRGELERWLTPSSAAVQVGGVDVGWSVDPTEILLADVHGEKLSWTLRVTLEGFDEAPFQRYLLAALDEICRPSEGWGLDATGEGRSLEAELRPHGFRGTRMTAVDFNANCDDRHPETLAILKDSKGEPKRTSVKHLTTQILKTKFGARRLAFPADPAVIHQWANHTRRLSRRGEPIYARREDHTIDAWRVLVWHLVQRKVNAPRPLNAVYGEPHPHLLALRRLT